MLTFGITVLPVLQKSAWCMATHKPFLCCKASLLLAPHPRASWQVRRKQKAVKGQCRSLWALPSLVSGLFHGIYIKKLEALIILESHRSSACGNNTSQSVAVGFTFLQWLSPELFLSSLLRRFRRSEEYNQDRRTETQEALRPVFLFTWGQKACEYLLAICFRLVFQTMSTDGFSHTSDWCCYCPLSCFRSNSCIRR